MRKKTNEFRFEQDTRMNTVSLNVALSDWGKSHSPSRRCGFCSITFNLGGLSYDWHPLLNFLDEYDEFLFNVICGRQKFVLKPRTLGFLNFSPPIEVNTLSKGSIANSNLSFNIKFTLRGVSYLNAIQFLQFLKNKTHKDLKFSIIPKGLSKTELRERWQKKYAKEEEGKHATKKKHNIKKNLEGT